MAAILYKWLIPVLFSVQNLPVIHPIYVSVTQIDYNKKEKALEISCKIFTDDLEKALRAQHRKCKVDLLDPALYKAMDSLVINYVTGHLFVLADSKRVFLKGIGYEQQEEGIVCFLQADNVNSVKKITVVNDILFESQKEQMNIIHVTVNGERQSTKLINPDSKAVFVF